MSNLHGGGTQFVSKYSKEKLDSNTPVEFVAVGDKARKANRENPVSITLSGPVNRVNGRFQPSGISLANSDGLTSAGNPPQAVLDLLIGAKLYDRIVDDVNPHTLPEEENLIDLAVAMRDLDRTNSVSGLPALFTYFGQFVAHDITHMRRNPADPLHVDNFRSHAFDLDSLFDRDSPIPAPQNSPSCRGETCVGMTRSFNGIAETHDDLPRTVEGAPCLPDRKNDNNLAVSQLTVAIIKFHQIVCKLRNSLSDDQKKTITRRHIQSIVIHDYLPKLIDRNTYYDTIKRGRVIVYPGFEANDFRVSTEFATGCFRFGHSLVRNAYNWGVNAPGKMALLRQILHLTHLDGISNRKHPIDARLRANWVADLNELLAANDVAGDGHHSSRIDLELADDLQNLKAAWFDADNLPNGTPGNALRLPLAQITMLRGLEQKLPTAQELYAHMSGILHKSRRPFGMILSSNEIRGPISNRSNFTSLWNHTPLWFYTLRESELLGHGGKQLGPIAGRVIMETLHAAISAVPNNIISNGGIDFEVLTEFKKTGIPDSEFTLKRLLEIVTSWSE